ncbi:MAG: OB-fold nucleic acid binding domain-containing protein [Candidatus Thorarchaeota archaeon]|jgi:replication factor A1
MLTLEETIERILKHRSDYERKDILKMIEEKRQELGPEVINDESAAMIVARELGVDLHQMSPAARQKIEDITETTRNVAITARVDNIGVVRTFSRKDGGGDGKVASIRVSDETGSIRVVLWDELTKAVEEELISVDDVIQLRGAYVKKGLGDSIELNLGRRGHIRQLEEYEIEELGVDFGTSHSEDMKISDLKEGLFGISVKSVIQRVFKLSTFTRQRDQSEGKVLSMIAADETGTVRLVFWDESATAMENVPEGEVIRLGNVNTRLNRDGTDVEVHVGKSAVIERGLKEKIDAVERAPVGGGSEPLGLKSIVDLATGMWDVDIEGKVVTAYDVTTFTTKDDKEGRVRNLVLADESGNTRVTFWNEDIDKIEDIKEGDIIKILHGYVKEGYRGGVEFQVGRKAEITINPKGSKLKKLDVSQVSLQPLTKASRVLIGDIGDNYEDNNVEICGIVVNLSQSMSPIYQACPSCNKKLEETDGGYVCKSCGKVDKPEPRMLYKITVDDGSGSMRVTLFGKVGEELLQMTAAEADKIIKKSGKDEQPLIENSDKVVGRYISVYGRVKKFRESLDLSANGFEFADPVREVKRLKEEIQKETA